MSPASIRPLTVPDAEALFELRRESLLEAPLAFLASPEDDVAASVPAVRQMLEGGSLVFGAFCGVLCGLLDLHRGRHVKAAHKINLWGLYVHPRCRRQGLGGQLLAAAIEHARSLEGARSIHLSVSSSAPAARRLYERAGFTLWGTEPDALQFAGQRADEHHLVLPLRA